MYGTHSRYTDQLLAKCGELGKWCRQTFGDGLGVMGSGILYLYLNTDEATREFCRRKIICLRSLRHVGNCKVHRMSAVSYTHLTLPTIYSV